LDGSERWMKRGGLVERVGVQGATRAGGWLGAFDRATKKLGDEGVSGGGGEGDGEAEGEE
jgi:hypothetical protein